MQIVFMVLSDHAALMLVPSMPPPPAVPPDGQPPLDPQTAMRNPSDASCLSLSEKARALAGRPACVGNVAARQPQVIRAMLVVLVGKSVCRCLRAVPRCAVDSVCLLGDLMLRCRIQPPPPTPTLGRALSMYDASRDKRFQPMTTSCPTQLPGGRHREKQHVFSGEHRQKRGNMFSAACLEHRNALSSSSKVVHIKKRFSSSDNSHSTFEICFQDASYSSTEKCI